MCLLKIERLSVPRRYGGLMRMVIYCCSFINLNFVDDINLHQEKIKVEESSSPIHTIPFSIGNMPQVIFRSTPTLYISQGDRQQSIIWQECVL